MSAAAPSIWEDNLAILPLRDMMSLPRLFKSVLAVSMALPFFEVMPVHQQEYFSKVAFSLAPSAFILTCMSVKSFTTFSTGDPVSVAEHSPTHDSATRNAAVKDCITLITRLSELADSVSS